MTTFSWPDPPINTAFPIAKPGYPFIFAGAFSTAIFALLGFTGMAFIGLLTTFFICFFFRDPDRVTPITEGAVIAPADGKIIIAEKVENSPFEDGPFLKISIFMTVFNVHVNRIPFSGKITKTTYFPGKFLSANLDKASKENEHNAIFIEAENGTKICTVQIAGLIARRIICNIQEGDEMKRGQRFGMICFGSRLDTYLPVDTKLNISIGDKVTAGTTVLGLI